MIFIGADLQPAISRHYGFLVPAGVIFNEFLALVLKFSFGPEK
jgi:hypothetical protein